MYCSPFTEPCEIQSCNVMTVKVNITAKPQENITMIVRFNKAMLFHCKAMKLFTIRGQTLMIWGAEEIEKKIGGPSPGNSQKSFPQKK